MAGSGRHAWLARDPAALGLVPVRSAWLHGDRWGQSWGRKFSTEIYL